MKLLLILLVAALAISCADARVVTIRITATPTPTEQAKAATDHDAREYPANTRAEPNHLAVGHRHSLGGNRDTDLHRCPHGRGVSVPRSLPAQ